jgi:hypothetical protein
MLLRGASMLSGRLFAQQPVKPRALNTVFLRIKYSLYLIDFLRRLVSYGKTG